MNLTTQEWLFVLGGLIIIFGALGHTTFLFRKNVHKILHAIERLTEVVAKETQKDD